MAANRVEVALGVNAEALATSLAELSTYIPQCPREFLKGAIRFRDFPLELVSLEIDTTTAAAGIVAIRFQPSDSLLGLLAALRTRNLD
jgi:hypothetical protein